MKLYVLELSGNVKKQRSIPRIEVDAEGLKSYDVQMFTDVYCSYCCSLNHTYINRQLMRHWFVLASTRRERKPHTMGKAIFLQYWTGMMALPGCWI